MKKVLLFVLITATMVSFYSCNKSSEAPEAKAATPKEPVEFIINNGAEPESLDPNKIEGVPEHRIYMALFEGLVAYDPKSGRAVPGMAESWDITNGGKTYTFHLRDAVWSDGVKITAQTFVDSWLRECNPETASPYSWFPAMFIEGADAYVNGEAGPEAVNIKAVDDKTFQINLVGPLPYVIDALAHYAFAVVPIHAIEKYGDDWIKPENFVSNGPFVLEEWLPRQQLSVVPNEKYWDRKSVKLDRVIYLSNDDNNTAHNMYLNGEADWNVTVPLDQMDAVQDEPWYVNAPYLGTYYYIIENKTAPFDDVRVRKALTLAIDRETIVKKITKGGQIPAYSMVPDMDGYPVLDDPKSHNFAKDVETAKKLLADAGYAGGAGFPDDVVILYNTSEAHKKIAEFIQEQWKQNLGINVTLQNMEWATYLQQRREHNFTVARAGWIGDYPDPNTFLDMFLAPESLDGAWGGNDGRYDNPKYDALIEKAATMEAGAARFSTLKEAEKYFITEDQGVLPIYFYTSNNLIDMDKWGGWYPNVMDNHPPKTIYLK
ncbi:MAG: peptide ABC transporter substrate-binding protein [Spirochaetales bacterium]|nr:peptide ABC transporter substrate-binding protein [Spirochaetales bacterium]